MSLSQPYVTNSSKIESTLAMMFSDEIQIVILKLYVFFYHICIMRNISEGFSDIESHVRKLFRISERTFFWYEDMSLH